MDHPNHQRKKQLKIQSKLTGNPFKWDNNLISLETQLMEDKPNNIITS